MKKSFITLSLFCIFYIGANAQAPCDCPVIPSRYQPHLRNEIGISAGAIYSPNHEEWGTAANIHYFRTVSNRSRWSLGGSIEQAFIDGSHWTFAAGVKYQINYFGLSVMPGVKFLNYDYSEKETLFSLNAEITYDLLRWYKFSLAPAVNYAWAKNYSHIMFGARGAFRF